MQLKQKRKAPKVSVCIITYNHESYIAECLNSIISQKTNFPFEIIIRDDNSTDNTYVILEEYAKKWPDLIKLLDSNINLGMNKNLKAVIDASEAEYIAICEGDDCWCNDNKIQYQYDLAFKNKSVNFYIHDCYTINSSSQDVKQNENRFFGTTKYEAFNCQDILNYAGQFAPTSSYFVKSSTLKSLPSWFDEAPIGDIFLELYAAKEAGGIYIPEKMSCYRVESIGSWTDRMKYRSSKDKLEYVAKMIFSIDKMKMDFPNMVESFDKKINALNFFAALAYLDIRDKVNFKIAITPINNIYVSKYHRILDLFKNIPIAPEMIVKLYRLIKSIKKF